MTVAYDGTAFHGWQVQPGQRTVQAELERAASEVLEVQDVKIHGAGRTDAGVHARGQVASFEAATHLPASAIAPLMNRRLPPDVRVTAAAEAAPGFHARHSAVARRYAYRLLAEDDLLASRFAWRPPRLPPIEALGRSAAPLVGEHDCSAFLTSGSSPVDPVCRITRAGWEPWESGVRFDVVANHFLYRMVRTLVGTSLVAAGTDDPARAMSDVLASRERSRAGTAAPPEGLCLEQVTYGDEEGAR